MKKTFVLIILGLVFINQVNAQDSDTLTNNSVIKMVKAKLSDELIIDVIKSSVVNFDLSGSSVKELTNQNVSAPVIEAMKSASGYSEVAEHNVTVSQAKEPEVVSKEQKTVNKEILPATRPETKSVSSNAGDLVASGYVAPLIDLIRFHENEFEKCRTSILEWNKKINELTGSARRIEEKIAETENELRDLKNADSKGYSDNILSLKKELGKQRETLESARQDILKAGDKATSELEKLSSESIRSASNKYNDVSQVIKSFNPDPSGFTGGIPVRSGDLIFSDNISDYFEPALEMLAWHKNKIKDEEEIIKKWNLKVDDAVEREYLIEEKMNPLKRDLEQYQTDQKKFKSEISAVKKQISSVEKEKKNLKDRVESDSRELSSYIKQERADIQKILDQRFADIIENIRYTFKSNSTL